jgi:hypothetical protein
MTNKKFKIPPQKIDSSDCVVHIGQRIEDGEIVDQGEPHKVHVGEWIKVIPIMSMKESISLIGISQMTDDIVKAERSLTEMCISLSKRVVDWNWTGLDSEPLDKPYQNPEVFENLNNEEIIWLVNASLGETPSEQKNELKDSLNIPSAENNLNNLPSR